MISSSARQKSIVLAAALLLAPAGVAAQSGPDAPDTPATPDDGAPAEQVPSWRFEPMGEAQLRLHALSDIPLRPLPGDMDGSTGNLGQNAYLSSWARLGGQALYEDSLRFVLQLDVLNGVIAGDVTQGVGDADFPRDERDFYATYPLRWLYVQWDTPYMRLVAGQKGSDWGLGMLANDGTHERPFGDHGRGDIVERLAVMTTPLGEGTPWVIGGGADLVFQDSRADLLQNERAVQGFLATWYQADDVFVGLYGLHRQQWNDLDDHSSVWVIDGHARVETEMLGGKGFTAVEAAAIVGVTEVAQTITHTEHDVLQALGVVQVGYEQDLFDTTLEAGYTTGDSNAMDGALRRASFDENFQVGLVLFPEVLAWHSARAAAWARHEDLVGRPARGSDELPTNGAVSGAAYLFPHASVHALPWLELRVGALFAWSTAAVTDPYRQRAYSENAGWLGGDPNQRYLGTELDGAVVMRHDLITDELTLTGGIEGGLFMPGPAFNDAAGSGADPMGLVRTKVGLLF